MSEAKYTTFLRVCNNWQQFATAEKKIWETDLTQAEARAACQQFNANRTADEIEQGAKLEFTESDNL